MSTLQLCTETTWVKKREYVNKWKANQVPRNCNSATYVLCRKEHYIQSTTPLLEKYYKEQLNH
jgi:hypothetical protein